MLSVITFDSVDLSVKTKCQSKKMPAARDLPVKAVSRIFPPAAGCQWRLSVAHYPTSEKLGSAGAGQ